MDGFEALFELEDGPLEEVVGEGSGSDGETECQQTGEIWVSLEKVHTRADTAGM